MDKQILDRIKKSEQRVVDLYGKVRDLNTTVYGGGGTQGLKEQYTILQIDPDNDTDANRGKALKELYQTLVDRNENNRIWRHTILVPPGNYYFDDGEPLVLNGEGINVVSLTGEPDVFLSVNYDAEPFAFDQRVQKRYDTPQEMNGLEFVDVGENQYGVNYGIDSQGIFFNDVDQDGAESYPVRFPGVINTTSDMLLYQFTFIHENACSDFGFAIWDNGTNPNWNWGPSNTLFRVQINCQNPIEIYGNSVNDSMYVPGGMVVGNKYRIIIYMYPGNLVVIVLIDDSTGSWIVWDSFNNNYAIPTGRAIRAGIAADTDGSMEGGSTMMHFTKLLGPQLATYFTPCLSVETNYVTVRGIVGANDSSSNWYNWSSEVEDYSYNLPIFVGPGLHDVTLENCIGGPFSFGADPYFNGNGNYYNSTFKNCRAPQGYSFGFGVNNYAVTVIDCNSLNYNGNYSPYCLNVNGGLWSIVTDCHFGDKSFIAYEMEISVKDTEVGQFCFQGYDYLDGIFENCKASNSSFRSDGGNIYGTYRNCIFNGEYTFYADSNIYATFYNCWFYNVQNLDGTAVNCYYCINYDSSMIVVNYAPYCVNITD